MARFALSLALATGALAWTLRSTLLSSLLSASAAEDTQAIAPGYWNSFLGVFSVSESTPSTSVHVNECYCYCSLYSYGYSGYYSVGYGATAGMVLTSTSWPSSLSWLPQWNGPVLSRSMVVAIALLLVWCRHLLAAIGAVGMGLPRHVRHFLAGVLADLGELQLILARGLCDALLVACIVKTPRGTAWKNQPPKT
eukprot:3604848-Amphidinium_carterae.1